MDRRRGNGGIARVRITSARAAPAERINYMLYHEGGAWNPAAGHGSAYRMEAHRIACLYSRLQHLQGEGCRGKQVEHIAPFRGGRGLPRAAMSRPIDFSKFDGIGGEATSILSAYQPS
eukprot:gene12208-biopygen11998